jgi:peptidyl-prolyl cis-trans isomerase C
MAVNCLTGAYGETQYFYTDSQTGRRHLRVRDTEDIEHAQAADDRLLLSDNATELGRALIQLACTCSTPSRPSVVGDSNLQALYDHYVAAQLSKEEFNLRFLRVSSRAEALTAIDKVRAGTPFEKVFDEYASLLDAKTFPHGDLGTHLETEWPSNQANLFRKLRVGEITLTPYEGIYGWEVYELRSKRTIPAPSLDDFRPRLTQYVTRAKSCGWPL